MTGRHPWREASTRDTADWYLTEASHEGPDVVTSGLQARLAGVRSVLALQIVDASGNVRASIGDAPGTPGDREDRAYVAAQRDGTSRGLHISDPMPARGAAGP